MTPTQTLPTTAIHWQPRLGTTSASSAIVTDLDDIAQCLHVIATTPKGSVPLQPTFGSDAWRYFDWPITRAVPHFVRELTAAWAAWEPRIKVVKISPMADAERLFVRVSYALVAGIAQQLADITLFDRRVP